MLAPREDSIDLHVDDPAEDHLEELMKRPAIGAIAAAVLLLGLIPSAASAAVAVPGVQDQFAGPNTGLSDNFTSKNLTQTFTAGITGVLTHLEIFCSGDGPVDLTVTVGATSDTNSCIDQAWTNFTFAQPTTVISGHQYTIDIVPANWVTLYASDADYPGGQALDDGGAVVVGGETTISDFAFVTFVLPGPTTTYSWSPSQVTAGTSTTVTLTTVTSFPDLIGSVPNAAGVEPNVAAFQGSYTVKLANLPAWFTPATLVCSSQIDPAICTLDNYKTGLAATGDGSPMVVTISVTGSAAPALAAAGTTGSATGDGCIGYMVGQNSMNDCDNAQGDLAVTGPAATPTATPTPRPSATLPPTTVTGGPKSSDSLPDWLAFAGLLAACGLALTINRQTRRVRP